MPLSYHTVIYIQGYEHPCDELNIWFGLSVFDDGCLYSRCSLPTKTFLRLFIIFLSPFNWTQDGDLKEKSIFASLVHTSSCSINVTYANVSRRSEFDKIRPTEAAEPWSSAACGYPHWEYPSNSSWGSLIILPGLEPFLSNQEPFTLPT